VWARGGVGTEECPKSLITPESVAMLESFFVWKAAGRVGGELTAREADAFAALEEEWRREVANGA
jgi:hypothetical protein